LKRKKHGTYPNLYERSQEKVYIPSPPSKAKKQIDFEKSKSNCFLKSALLPPRKEKGVKINKHNTGSTIFYGKRKYRYYIDTINSALQYVTKVL